MRDEEALEMTALALMSNPEALRAYILERARLVGVSAVAEAMTEKLRNELDVLRAEQSIVAAALMKAEDERDEALQTAHFDSRRVGRDLVLAQEELIRLHAEVAKYRETLESVRPYINDTRWIDAALASTHEAVFCPRHGHPDRRLEVPGLRCDCGQ